VLDNFEHVLAAGPLVADLLAAAPALTVLATSREPLRLRAERLFRLEPLALPPDGTVGAGSSAPAAPAVELFVAVAQARDQGFALTPRNVAAVAEVCRRLDGLPLAIELAAGRVGLLSLRELNARLRDGLDILGTASRDAPPRQRTLNATLEWSYALLEPPEQAALAALAVFAGGCTLEAAETVAAAPVAVLEALVDKNLVVVRSLDDDSRRVDMLETVREFTRARFAELPNAGVVHRRHAEYYLALAERAAAEQRRRDALALVAELDHELNNMRAALTWSLEQPAPVPALRLATALRPYPDRRGLYQEPRHRSRPRWPWSSLGYRRPCTLQRSKPAHTVSLCAAPTRPKRPPA